MNDLLGGWPFEQFIRKLNSLIGILEINQSERFCENVDDLTYLLGG